jgi:hypothetical protein
MSEASNPSLLYPIAWVFVGVRTSDPIMDAELLVQKIANKISPEPIRQIFEKKVLAKVLTPGEFEFGLGSHSLSRYCYAPGEIILCRRHRGMGALAQSHSNAADHRAGPDVPFCRRGDVVCASFAFLQTA